MVQYQILNINQRIHIPLYLTGGDSDSDGSGPFESYDEDDGFSSDDDDTEQQAPSADFIPLPR